MNAKKDFKNWREVLDYLKEDCGRKVGQTKLFDDISKARLRKQTEWHVQTAGCGSLGGLAENGGYVGCCDEESR